MKMLRSLVLAVALFSAPALAQNVGTVTSHAFAVGKGAGVAGYTSLLCGAGQLAVAQASADPICRTVSGDWTLNAAGVSTLATVNANVGSFGSATNCPTFTTNAKGLLTAASQTACTPAIGNVTGLGAGVATWLGTPNSANLAAALTDETGTPGSAVFSVSPALTGTPTAPTAAAGTNTTQIATTAGIVAERTATRTSTNQTIAATANTIQMPRFSASQSGNVSVATSGTAVKAAPNTVLFDTNSWYDGVTNFRYTPQLAGKYNFTGVCEGVGTTVTEVDAEFRLNGTTYARVLNLASGTATTTSVKKYVTMNGTTDFVELWCIVSGTTGGTTLVVQGGSAPIRTWFEGEYTGP